MFLFKIIECYSDLLFVFSAESVWVKPKEGFLTLKEYKKLNEQALVIQEEAKQRDYKYSVQNADEIAAKYRREQLRAYKVKDDVPVAETCTTENISYMEPSEMSQPYGEWQEVVVKKPKIVDLELPAQQFVPLYVPSVPVEPADRKYKEKTVSLVADRDAETIPGVFKKRKIAGRQGRQRLDDN